MKINIKEFRAVLFALLIYTTVIVDLFRIICNSFLQEADGYVTLFRNIVYILIFAATLFFCIYDKRKTVEFILISVTYVLLILFSIIINPRIQGGVLDNILMAFSRIIPAYLISSSVDDVELAISKILRGKWFLLAYIISFVVLGRTGTRYYYMNVGYNLLFPTLILFFAKTSKAYINKVIALFSMLIILLFCARGTSIVMLLAILAYYFAYLMNSSNSKKKMVQLFICICGGIGLIVVLPILIDFLYRKFPTSRTLYYLVSGNITNLSGRDNYYVEGVEELVKHPFKIRGILGDRVFYGDVFQLSDIEGAFAHNLFLELMLQFGVLGGLILSFFVMRNVYKCVMRNLKTKIPEDIVIVCAIIVPSFIICMTTASYLSSIETVMMLGLCIVLNKKYVSS